MPDIAKCTGEGCILKQKCFRFTSEADEYQAYFLKPPIKKNKCEMFWGNFANSIYEDFKKITNDTKKRK